MSFGAGHWPYLFILLVIVLIIWGPGKLPELGSGMGKAIREFRKASSEVKDQIVQTTATEPAAAAPQPAATPAAPQPAATPAAPPAAAASPAAHPTTGEQPSA
jgi:TatA/E family protein of Tat protein translocase